MFGGYLHYLHRTARPNRCSVCQDRRGIWAASEVSLDQSTARRKAHGLKIVKPVDTQPSSGALKRDARKLLAGQEIHFEAFS